MTGCSNLLCKSVPKVLIGEYDGQHVGLLHMAPPVRGLPEVACSSVLLLLLQLLWRASSSAMRLYLAHLAKPSASTAGATHTAILRDIPGVSRGTILDQVGFAALLATTWAFFPWTPSSNAPFPVKGVVARGFHLCRISQKPLAAAHSLRKPQRCMWGICTTAVPGNSRTAVPGRPKHASCGSARGGGGL
jgi:hypothetical protein